MLNLGVIPPVDRPTNWINSILLSEKKSNKEEVTKLRPHYLNKWTKREHHCLKTVDEVVTTKLKGGTFFTFIDAKKGFWH